MAVSFAVVPVGDVSEDDMGVFLGDGLALKRKNLAGTHLILRWEGTTPSLITSGGYPTYSQPEMRTEVEKTTWTAEPPS